MMTPPLDIHPLPRVMQAVSVDQCPLIAVAVACRMRRAWTFKTVSWRYISTVGYRRKVTAVPRH
jgi:hypothetical protein